MTIRAKGALLARALSRSWRRELPPLELTPSEFADVLPLAVSSGVGGLVWRRVRGTSLENLPGAEQLQAAYRHYAIQNAVHTMKLKAAFSLLRSLGIEPVLAKGWSLSGVYPEPGMRPFGDIDLCVRPEQYAEALSVLDTPKHRSLEVDLHSGFGKFYDDRTEELFSRSELVKLEDSEIRVLKVEDHLRFLCLHLLRHGANRSLWLCDVAASLESIDENFKWDLATGTQQPQAEWVECAVSVAKELLGSEVNLPQFAANGGRPPAWLAETILEEWGTPYVFPDQIATMLRNPVLLVKELPKHWPNPIEATVNLGGRFDESSRLRFQVGEVFVKVGRLVKNVTGKAK